MKMKRFVTAAVALLLMVSLVGTGFSYWFFGNYSVTNSDTQISKGVTQLVTVGSITAASNFTIKFDQTVTGRTNNGGSVSLSDTPAGITLDFGTGADIKKVAKYTQGNEVGGFTFTTTITISKSLAEYIDFSYEGGFVKSRTDGEGNTVITFTKNGATEFDWTKVKLTYNNKEPQNATEYGTLKSAVESASNTISVTYAVTLKDATTKS